MRPWSWLERYRRSSQRVRFHQYTRYLIYSFVLVEAMLIGVWAVAMPAGSTPWLWPAVGIGSAHVALNLLVTRSGLAHYLGLGERPVRSLAAFTLVTLAASGGGLWLIASGRLDPGLATIVSWPAMFFCGPVLLALPLRPAMALAALPPVATGVGLLAIGLPEQQRMALLISMAVGGFVFGASYRCSGWTLRVVDELDAARESQARLAVAEERLRFSRDLHDVLGRNLSVIALKSELAVQLSQRGSPSATDQMTEVQRIAQESQREIREVARGYREANLHSELEGARGVLAAAGVDCRIEDEAASVLPAPVQAALGWVVREGTTNVLRHAEAGRCTVRLRRTRDLTVLEMENDGAVPDSGQPAPGPAGVGSGLAGLRERVAVFGGTVTAGTEAGGTFRLTAAIPVHPDLARTGAER